jgi:hypothetical protein
MEKAPEDENTEDTRRIDVQKSVAEQWLIYNESGYWLSSIFLNNESGEISIYSDFGNYGYRWSKEGRGGKTLKQFLIEISLSPGNLDYVIKKLHKDVEKGLDFTSTLKSIKDDILIAFKAKHITKAEYERYLKDLGSLSETQSVLSFSYEFAGFCADLLSQMYSNDLTTLPLKIEYNEKLRLFMENVWVKFLDAIRLEGTC